MARFEWQNRLRHVLEEPDQRSQIRKAEEYDRELENFLSTVSFGAGGGGGVGAPVDSPICRYTDDEFVVSATTTRELQIFSFTNPGSGNIVGVELTGFLYSDVSAYTINASVRIGYDTGAGLTSWPGEAFDPTSDVRAANGATTDIYLPVADRKIALATELPSGALAIRVRLTKNGGSNVGMKFKAELRIEPGTLLRV